MRLQSSRILTPCQSCRGAWKSPPGAGRGPSTASRCGNPLPRKRGTVGVGVSLGRRSQGLGNRLQHARSVPENVVVPEAEDAPTLPVQPVVALIMIARTRVLSAIGFDNQSRVNTGEIHDVGRDRELAPESKLAPQHAL